MADRGEAAVSREILHQEGFYPEESSGLFVGISTFEDERFAAVRFAVDDAVDLAWVFSLELGLVDAGSCVLALAGEPQKEKSRARLGALLAAGAKREHPGLTKVYQLASELSHSGSTRGLFVVAAATHGLSEQGGDYLIAADSRYDRLLRTAIPIQELFDTAASAAARRRLMLLDACRERLSEKRSLADPAMSQSFAAAIAKATGLTVLSGSTVGGYSYDDSANKNGVFTGALVEGLLGAAAADTRGFITVTTLADFAQERVQAWVRRNRPQHSELTRGIERRYDESAEKLPLAIDPRRARQIAEYLERRAAALKKLRDNIDDADGAIITGELFGEISRFLRPEKKPAEADKLLEALESLDGKKPMQRVLRDVWREIREGPALTPLKSPRILPTRKLTKPKARILPAAVVETATSDFHQPQPGELALDHFGLRFRWIPGGTYTIGSPVEDEERSSNEDQKQVSIEGFWLAEVPITQAFWMQQGLENPSRFGFRDEANCPVEQVSWYDAVAFANLLSVKAGLEVCYELGCRGTIGEKSFTCNKAELKKAPCSGYRLPTEAEWEVAARAQGPSTPYRARYGELDAIAWHAGNSGGKPHSVGKKLPNDWGLHEMLGNVWEWTGDLYVPTSSDRVARGCSWVNDAEDIRAACRVRVEPGDRSVSLGFRLVLGQLRSGEGRGAR